jgi:hypothetical protein
VESEAPGPKKLIELIREMVKGENMRRKHWKLLSPVLAIAAVLSMALPSLGWGAGGHMMVASIAYGRLNPTAKAQVDKLVAIQIAPEDVTAQSLNFVDAAHWADDIRSSPDFKSFAPLHFIDQPFTNDDTDLPSDLPEAENVVTALTHNVEVLKNSGSSDGDKAQALRFIIHFVGDIHQPLHCATLVTEKNAEGDRGGNLFKIKLPAGQGKTKSSNLHSYWDSGIGSFPKTGANFSPPALKSIAPAAAAATKANPDTDGDWQDGGPFDFAGWAKESEDLAESTAYNKIQPGRLPSQSYNRAALKVARQRVAWGGYRLAALLNAIWP